MLDRNYELVILATKKKLYTLQTAIPFYKNNLNIKNTIIIAPASLENEVEKIPDVIFIDENTVYPGLSYDVVENILYDICEEKSRTGWYFQQFLKFAWAYHCQDPYYVVIDADTFPLNPIEFVGKDGKYLFTPKIEYNKPYFDTINRLFKGKIRRAGDFSFIAENMIFDCNFVKEMISTIESNSDLLGDCYYEKILYAVDPKDLPKSGFSEFETYGNYMFAVHLCSAH